MNKINGFTVIVPSFGSADRAVVSAAKQWFGKDYDYKIEILIFDDDIEYRNENGKSRYEYLLDYKTDNVDIKIIENKEHLYQGKCRVLGAEMATYDWVFFMDSDDEYTPFCIRSVYDMLTDYYSKKDHKKVASIGYNFLGFDVKNFHPIGDKQFSIWVQGRCWNRKFILEHNLHTIYERGVNSKCAEDYPFVTLFDYYVQHEQDEWESLLANFPTPLAYWFPNYDSLSRQPHYGQHLAGFTMRSSCVIYRLMKEYNEQIRLTPEEDEFLKKKILNMTIYSYFNIADYVREISISDWESTEEEWILLKDSCKEMKNELLHYWKEIQYADIEDEMFGVRHYSDCRVSNVWFGTFYDYMNKDVDLLQMDYKDMIKYAKSLKFDAINCLQSPQVQAWKERHISKNK